MGEALQPPQILKGVTEGPLEWCPLCNAFVPSADGAGAHRRTVAHRVAERWRAHGVSGDPFTVLQQYAQESRGQGSASNPSGLHGEAAHLQRLLTSVPEDLGLQPDTLFDWELHEPTSRDGPSDKEVPSAAATIQSPSRSTKPSSPPPDCGETRKEVVIRCKKVEGESAEDGTERASSSGQKEEMEEGRHEPRTLQYSPRSVLGSIDKAPNQKVAQNAQTDKQGWSSEIAGGILEAKAGEKRRKTGGIELKEGPLKRRKEGLLRELMDQARRPEGHRALEREKALDETAGHWCELCNVGVPKEGGAYSHRATLEHRVAELRARWRLDGATEGPMVVPGQSSWGGGPQDSAQVSSLQTAADLDCSHLERLLRTGPEEPTLQASGLFPGEESPLRKAHEGGPSRATKPPATELTDDVRLSERQEGVLARGTSLEVETGGKERRKRDLRRQYRMLAQGLESKPGETFSQNPESPEGMNTGGPKMCALCHATVYQDLTAGEHRQSITHRVSELMQRWRTDWAEDPFGALQQQVRQRWAQGSEAPSSLQPEAELDCEHLERLLVGGPEERELQARTLLNLEASSGQLKKALQEEGPSQPVQALAAELNCCQADASSLLKEQSETTKEPPGEMEEGEAIIGVEVRGRVVKSLEGQAVDSCGAKVVEVQEGGRKATFEREAVQPLDAAAGGIPQGETTHLPGGQVMEPPRVEAVVSSGLAHGGLLEMEDTLADMDWSPLSTVRPADRAPSQGGGHASSLGRQKGSSKVEGSPGGSRKVERQQKDRQGDMPEEEARERRRNENLRRQKEATSGQSSERKRGRSRDRNRPREDDRSRSRSAHQDRRWNQRTFTRKGRRVCSPSRSDSSQEPGAKRGGRRKQEESPLRERDWRDKSNTVCFDVLMRLRCDKKTCPFRHPARPPKRAAQDICLRYISGTCPNRTEDCHRYHWNQMEEREYLRCGQLPSNAICYEQHPACDQSQMRSRLNKGCPASCRQRLSSKSGPSRPGYNSRTSQSSTSDSDFTSSDSETTSLDSETTTSDSGLSDSDNGSPTRRRSSSMGGSRNPVRALHPKRPLTAGSADSGDSVAEAAVKPSQRTGHQENRCRPKIADLERDSSVSPAPSALEKLHALGVELSDVNHGRAASAEDVANSIPIWGLVSSGLELLSPALHLVAASEKGEDWEVVTGRPVAQVDQQVAPSSSEAQKRKAPQTEELGAEELRIKVPGLEQPEVEEQGSIKSGCTVKEVAQPEALEAEAAGPRNLVGSVSDAGALPAAVATQEEAGTEAKEVVFTALGGVRLGQQRDRLPDMEGGLPTASDDGALEQEGAVGGGGKSHGRARAEIEDPLSKNGEEELDRAKEHGAARIELRVESAEVRSLEGDDRQRQPRPVRETPGEGSFWRLRIDLEAARAQVERERREGQRVFQEKMRKLEEQLARAASEEAANGRERERLQAEWRELGERKRASTGVGECIVCMEDWGETVVRHHFACGHAVMCRKCCADWVARQSKPPYKCLLGCNLKRSKAFKPVYLG